MNSNGATSQQPDGHPGRGNGSGRGGRGGRGGRAGRGGRNHRRAKKQAPATQEGDFSSNTIIHSSDTGNAQPLISTTTNVAAPEVPADSTAGRQPARKPNNNKNYMKRQVKPQPTVNQQGDEDSDNNNNAGSKQSAEGNYKQPQKKNRRGRGRGRGHSNDTDGNAGGATSAAGRGKGGRGGRADDKIVYPPYWELKDCLTRYNAKDPDIIRGTLRVLPGMQNASFCTCDRGSQAKDVLIPGALERNRALDGDQVFVELLPLVDETDEQKTTVEQDEPESDEEDKKMEGDEELQESWWQDDDIQVSLWDPVVPIQRTHGIPKPTEVGGSNVGQRRARVIHVIPPASFGSEINPTQQASSMSASRRVVGTLKRMNNGTTLLTSANRSLTQFRLSDADAKKFNDSPVDAIFSAKYVYGSWKHDFKWPPCEDVVQFGLSCNVEDETTALLIDNQVDHGEFPSSVLEECQNVVSSGEYTNGEESGWKPTPEMYSGRRDFRQRRIFTIDPTTAKDLDDALHIEELENGQIELGVHIADVSHFIEPNSMIDLEAQRRCTTVYLVDRTIPMLPRPLCEIACSLNENVERLAFTCVWRMNRDGSLVKGHKVWYGRSVIKSCARLDYATAQNIIDKKVAFGENQIDEDLWPLSRRPTGKHTVDQVAADVRLMHEVGMARRLLRFQNGAVALQAVKLTFQLDTDRETPLLCEPYPIRDSNRLVEEYMLLANYLVAQRMITHAGGKALLRNHEPPLFEGLEKVVEVAKEAIGFQIDISSSEALQRSLNRLGRECRDELVLQTITEMLKLPMQAANYIAAGSMGPKEWSHFALNIPYYTHFTSPIRRYADVIVHRVLQATLDGQEAVDDFVLTEKDIESICDRCNDKKEGSRKAQERSDIIFLALYLRRNPMKSKMGIVVSIGQKTFTVFIPSLGVSTLLFLDEHTSWIKSYPIENPVMGRRIKLERIAGHNGERWKELTIKNFAKIRVTCKCQDKPPIGVKLELEGPWTENGN